MNLNNNKSVRFALFALAATFFGIGVTEFISVGVLPAIAKSFNISTSQAGLITTIYALGVALGAPILIVLTAGIQRKKTILGAIITFIIGHLIIGFAPTFGLVIFGRLVAGAAHGLLFALSSTIAAELVGPSKQASAIAFIFGGFTVATAIGAPLGTSVSDLIGWRIPFLAIAVLGVIALFLNIFALPNKKNEETNRVKLEDQFRLAIHPHVLLTLLITILGYGGTFATFTYLSPILQNVTHVPSNEVSIILVIYGIAITIGNSLGGKFGDKNPVQSLFKIFIIQAIALFAFFFTSSNLVLAILNIIVLGLLAFMSVPILQSYILSLANSYVPEAIDMASSLNIASFNLGIVLGSFVGGLAITNWGLKSTALVAGIMVVLALLLNIVESSLEAKRIREF